MKQEQIVLPEEDFDFDEKIGFLTPRNEAQAAAPVAMVEWIQIPNIGNDRIKGYITNSERVLKTIFLNAFAPPKLGAIASILS